MERRPAVDPGVAIVAAALGFSLVVSLYHVWTHEAPLVPTILGQGSLLALTLLFGVVAYYAFGAAASSGERLVVGSRAGAGYALAGLASGGYAHHQQLTPEATLAGDVILFQATFVGLVGGVAGLLVGLETARRKRSLAEYEATTSELEATKADIRTEKRRFESLFRNSPSAIADLEYTDGEPTVCRANDAFEALLEPASADVEGTHLFEVVPLCEDETEAAVAAHVADNEIYEDEVTVDHADGLGHYKLRVIPYEVGSETEHAFALYTDVTELRTTRQELDESVERLEASNERLEQFAYAISHDLQEPLRMVSSYLQMIESRYGDELDADGREFVEFAVDGAERMRAMIDSLLQYSRVTTRGEPLEPTDADAVLDDVLTDLEPRIEETGATVTSEELPTVTADADQLAQVFRNLVSNALKYSGDEPPRVHVSAERTEEAWRFAVADEGVGIEPDQRDRIFDVFETVHADEEDSSTGIGLALCQRILERHDGEIWVDSTPGEGSTFHFTIPIPDDREPAVDGRSAPQQH